MNKQEALKQIEEQRDMILDLHGWGVFGYIKGIINQLDEPQKIEFPKVDFKKSQKVKVPQFVAEYINLQKKNNFHVYGAMRVIEDHYDKKVPEWFYGKNIETFVRAWLDGYEVEEEKRYRVKIKGEIKENILVYGFGIERYFFARTYDSSKRGGHTRKELKEAGLGWVFDCPGIEIEEVE